MRDGDWGGGRRRRDGAGRWGMPDSKIATPGSESGALGKVLCREMHMWSPISHNRPPRAPSAGLIAHPQNPKVPENKILPRDSGE